MTEEKEKEIQVRDREKSLPVVYEDVDLKLKIQYLAGIGLSSAAILEVLGAQLPGLAIAVGAGCAAAYFAEELHGTLGPGLRATRQLIAYLNRNRGSRTVNRLTSRDWWLGQETALYVEEEEEKRTEPPIAVDHEARTERLNDLLSDSAMDDTSEDDEKLFQTASQLSDIGIKRLTVEQIVRNTVPNSYKVWVGRSLTDPEYKAVQINFYKQHFRFMGASQRGKSSMVAAFLDIVTQTHDPKHVRLALLDMEDQTSKLFAHLPHVATVSRGGQRVRLHARNADEVLDRLISVVAIMESRYGMTKAQVVEQPILLVYVEEFLALKNEFKARIGRSKTKGKEEQEKSQSDYATLVYCIESLAMRGLKARVQLLLCAQVEYADDDFREALASVSCGFAFCVRPTAAASAGFQNGELIRRNAKENKVGQAAVETPDCNDLVLAPAYDLEQKLLDFERIHNHSHSQVVSEFGDSQHENVNAVNLVNQPVERIHSDVNTGEYSLPSVNFVNDSPMDSQSHSQTEEILLACIELQQAGKTVTRTGIRDHLGWNNRQYQEIIKPVCDRHGIAGDR